jgi:cobalt-zinc-cadmium efflux system protein
VSHDHAHVHGGDAETRIGPLCVALGLILAFMAAEVALAVVARSLALLSDAAHMLVDAGALALSVWAARLSRRPPEGRMTFGLRRAETLAAQANGVLLALLGAAIAVESIRRLGAPAEVRGGLVTVTACVGAAVNVLALLQVARANRRSLNVEGSFQHLLTDLYAFAGTAVAGIAIWTTDFDRADPIASLAVSALMLRAAWPLLRASGRVLLEGAPEGLEPGDVLAAISRQPGVVDVHDLHVWEIATGFPALSAHVLVGRDEDCHAIRRSLEGLLHERFAVDHTTLQVEHTADRLLTIRPLRGRVSRSGR